MNRVDIIDIALGHRDNTNWTYKNAPSGRRDQISLILKYIVDNEVIDDMHEFKMNPQIGFGYTAARWHVTNFVSQSTWKP